jgi:hypothetical protein
MTFTMATAPPTQAHHLHVTRRRARTALNALVVRLRFPAVLVLAFLVVGKWDVLRNYWDTWTRPVAEDTSAFRPVSNDTEYFCPMDPGVVSDWPTKCGVCNMALVRRKRGEATALPDGVVARMQLTPYRIQLAGLRTAPAGYRPLAAEAESAGVARIEDSEGPGSRHVIVLPEFAPRDGWLLLDGQEVSVTCDDVPGHDPFRARLRSVSPSPTVLVEDPGHELRSGMVLTVRVSRALAEIEPFRSLPSDLPPIRKGEARTVYACPDHPDTLGAPSGRCTVDGIAFEPHSLAANQRLRWWCPMHPDVTSDTAGQHCGPCDGMLLRPRVVTYRPPGQILSVPESAVVDTGKHQVVFLERMPGMFEGVEVTLGPRCGGWFPVVRGLEPGQSVVVAGAFLLDAETRLNPSLASAYFGASRTANPTPPETAQAPNPQNTLAGLMSDDAAAARRQSVCPVTRKALGSMGTPIKVLVNGRTVFLCCSGCEDRLRKDPARFLEPAPTPRP